MRNNSWKYIFIALLSAIIVTSCALILTPGDKGNNTPDPPQPIPQQPQAKFMQHCDEESSYNHRPYPEHTGELIRINDRVRLHPDAAEAYLSMEQAAKMDGITLVALSGFRNFSQQQYLFYEIAKQRNQTLEERAFVSAPPGHSEHATGLAVDVNSLDESFAETEAYEWLLENAGGYGYILSFPKDNDQGIAFEPWHWKFVGTDKAAQILCEKPIN